MEWGWGFVAIFSSVTANSSLVLCQLLQCYPTAIPPLVFQILRSLLRYLIPRTCFLARSLNNTTPPSKANILHAWLFIPRVETGSPTLADRYLKSRDVGNLLLGCPCWGNELHCSDRFYAFYSLVGRVLLIFLPESIKNCWLHRGCIAVGWKSKAEIFKMFWETNKSHASFIAETVAELLEHRMYAIWAIYLRS